MKTVLVIRNGDAFSRILAASGFEVINLPLIETKIFDDLSEFEEKLESVENYDGVFLTSAVAAEVFRSKLVGKNIAFYGKVYVLGKRIYELLTNENLDLYFNETANTAREMLEGIARENLTNKNFLFVRGDKSLRIVPDYLSKASKVDEAVVYETRNIKIEIDKINCLRGKFEGKEIAAVCFFSPSAAANFIEQFGAEITHQTVITAIGKTTAEFFERQNLRVNFVSSKAAAKDFAVELSKYLRGNLPAKDMKEMRRRKH